MYYVPEWFRLEEVVCPHVFNKFGYFAWSFFDDRSLRTMNMIRQKVGKTITINTWIYGGEFSQRGLRCIQCSLVKTATNEGRVYCSPHIRGCAFDFDIKGLTAEESRQWIIKNKELWPWPIRLEKDVNWVHLDTAPVQTYEKITLINP